MNFLLEGPGGLTGIQQGGGFTTNLSATFKGAVDMSAATSVTLPATGTGAQTITSASANALTVGPNGTTNPALNIDNSVASAATGLNIQSQAAGSSVLVSVTSSGGTENLRLDSKGSGSALILQQTSLAPVQIFKSLVIGEGGNSSANALTVGPNGTTNPAFNVDNTTASAATGLNVKSAAAAGGLAVTTTSSGTDENLTVNAKGAGTITLNGTATGNITLGSTSNLVNFAQTAIAVGGGATATLGTIGGSGPGTAGQNAWLKVNIAGTASYVPFWR